MISSECNIPHTRAYRKIKTLLDYNLLTITKIAITDDGKKYSILRVQEAWESQEVYVIILFQRRIFLQYLQHVSAHTGFRTIIRNQDLFIHKPNIIYQLLNVHQIIFYTLYTNQHICRQQILRASQSSYVLIHKSQIHLY